MTTNVRFPAPGDGHLTPEMKLAWDDCGVLLLEGFKSEAECDALTERARRIAREADLSEAGVFASSQPAAKRDEYFRNSGDTVRCFLEEEAIDEDGNLLVDQVEAINKIGHAMHDLDPVFDAFSHSPRLATIAREVGLKDARVLQSMFIFKPPRIGGKVIWHQDGTYLYTEPQSVIGFWFALDDASKENGCLYAIPGGHDETLRSRFVRKGDGFDTNTLDDSDFDVMASIPLEAKKGDMVILHGRLPHASESNRSDRSRHAYTLHVVDGACDYPEDNWLQRREDMPLRGFER
ncbi:MAG: phytanoyl-CoA dioxygenase family protein [Alphaproteobacteria bacterium]|jgi:phytanoyl-CoA hydroxylase|nr:phytanoyl-CoA dioxygenase family protein [Alphaproteobacteria bacterium]MBT4086396.1 phytanoyl-CoA dioxygenase family protein [Alphaproteobacteria bacterium]MBT4546376.1 phytanoyl-CoA dioxygenase family protein [Alphaproteobacteria bacterium]MBT6386298.1 phytanoyl-CoA dioxygenase family protein [Alphaproteobacteria bacterium]